MQIHPDFIFPSIKHLIVDKSFSEINHKYRKLDEQKDVDYNLNFIKEYARVDQILILNQIHSNNVILVDDKNITKHLDADAFITKQRNIAIAIYTADCIPILFADPKNMVIGIAHAGWKGTKSGIIENTISEMVSIGAESSEIEVLVGPCIHQESYEVSNDYYSDFMSETPQNNRFFIESKNAGHYMFDLPGYAKSKILGCSVKSIHQIHKDTLQNPELYPSYRRSTINKTPHSECFLSIIWIS